MQGFASYASHLLASTSAANNNGGATASTSGAPLFYSTRDSYIPFDESDDILGASAETEGDDLRGRYDGTRTGLSFGEVGDSSRGADTEDDSSSFAGGGGGVGRSSNKRDTTTSSMISGLDLPAFVSRINPVGRGWKAHESHYQQPPRFYPEQDDLSEEEDEALGYIEDVEEEEGPPGAFLSSPSPSTSRNPNSEIAEPLLAPRTLFVYPMPGQTEGVRANAIYRDSQWIVVYGVSVVAVFLLGIREWWHTIPPNAPSSPSYSIFGTLPILLTLSFVSLLAGVSSATYILAVRHGMRHFINGALIAGPLLFVGAGVLSFAGSFGGSGAASDRGWKAGMRWFALVCFVWAYVLGLAAVSRRKQVARAIALGELATQMILEHPPLILLCLTLSILSAIIALPCLTLISNLLFDVSTSSSWLPGWGSVLTLLVYAWTLSILRGLQHAVVGGVVGANYFERTQEDYPGAVVVTRAALHRATHGSLGTIIFASAVTSLATSTTTILKRLQSILRSKNLPPFFQPLTYLVPVMGIVSSLISSFNGYAISYAGLTGQPYLESARSVSSMIRQNRTSALGDSLLVRLVFFVVSFGFGLLAGLIAFLLASSRLASGVRLTPVMALLCYFVPVWTLKLCHDVLGDTVDALFICLNIDLMKGECHSEETKTAFATAEIETSFV